MILPSLWWILQPVLALKVLKGDPKGMLPQTFCVRCMSISGPQEPHTMFLEKATPALMWPKYSFLFRPLPVTPKERLGSNSWSLVLAGIIDAAYLRELSFLFSPPSFSFFPLRQIYVTRLAFNWDLLCSRGRLWIPDLASSSQVLGL